MLGVPVPDNLHLMDKAALHKAHSGYDAEIAEINAKKLLVRDAITAKDQAESLATRAGFDTVLALGPRQFTLAKAQQYLADFAEGLVSLPANMLDRLKKIVESGKDEE